MLTIVSALFLSGCDTPIPSETTASNTTKTFTVDNTGSTVTIEPSDDDISDLSGYPVTINDTVINKMPGTAVCLSSSLTEIICELGYGDKLIGRGVYCEYPDSITTLESFGRPASPDIEALKKASPDVLITATAIPSIDIKALNESDIAVVYIPSPRTIQEFERIYSALGMRFEGMFEGEKTAAAAFSSISKTFLNSDLTIGSFIYVTEGWTIAGGDTFESSVLSCFGTNAADEFKSYYSGDLGDIQPDIVLMNSDLSREDILNNELFSELEAVKDGKITEINNRFFESPSGRMTDLINELKGTGVTAH